MQSNDELYSTDINPVIAAYQAYDTNQPEITSTGEMDKDPRKMMPVAGANETTVNEDKNTGDKNAGDEQELADAAETDAAGSGTIEDTAAEHTDDDTYYDASDVEGNATALNKNKSISHEDDTSGVY